MRRCSGGCLLANTFECQAQFCRERSRVAWGAQTASLLVSVASRNAFGLDSGRRGDLVSLSAETNFPFEMLCAYDLNRNGFARTERTEIYALGRFARWRPTIHP